MFDVIFLWNFESIWHAMPNAWCAKTDSWLTPSLLCYLSSFYLCYMHFHICFLFFYFCPIQSHLLYFMTLWFSTFSNVFFDIFSVQFVCCAETNQYFTSPKQTHPERPPGLRPTWYSWHPRLKKAPGPTPQLENPHSSVAISTYLIFLFVFYLAHKTLTFSQIFHSAKFLSMYMLLAGMHNKYKMFLLEVFFVQSWIRNPIKKWLFLTLSIFDFLHK